MLVNRNNLVDLPTDFGSLLRVAIPISMGTMVQFIVVLTDNFFLSRAGQAAINGAGNAGLVYLTLEMVAIGSAAAFQILIARRLGEGRHDEVNKTFRSGLFFHAFLGMVILLVTAGLNQGFLGSLIADELTRAIFEPFLSIRMWGFLPLTLVLMLNAYFTGSAKTWPILVTTGCMAGLNVVLDAAWVEGWFGATARGPLGAAQASLVSEWLGLGIALLLAWRIVPELRHSRRIWKAPDWKKWWKLARPLMGQLLLTIATWTTFFFLVEKVGSLELKVSHIARNLFMLAFVVSQGMSQTTRTYVSGLLGGQRDAELRGTLKRIVILNVSGILLLCHGFVLYPEFLAGIFFDSEVGLEAMRKTLYVIFSAVCLYAFTGIALATLQGAGATVQAFRVELLAVGVYLLVGIALTLVWPQPVWIIWRVEWVYFSLIGMGSIWYLKQGTWRHVLASNSSEINQI